DDGHRAAADRVQPGLPGALPDRRTGDTHARRARGRSEPDDATRRDHAARDLVARPPRAQRALPARAAAPGQDPPARAADAVRAGADARAHPRPERTPDGTELRRGPGYSPV